MDRRPLKTRSQPWVAHLAKALVAAGWKPNQISMLSVAAALVSGGAFLAAARWPVLLVVAAAGIQGRLLCNLLDGMMAVEGGLKTKVGDLFNDIPDRIADVVILACAGYCLAKPALGWAASVLSLMTAYLRVLGGSLGLPQDFSGPLAKQQRMFWMTVGALGGCVEAAMIRNTHPFLLEVALAWVVIGAAITCVKRIERLVESLNAR